MSARDETTRDWFRDAADGFAELVGGIDPREWERESLGVWTLRALVGHTSRALSTVERAIARAEADGGAGAAVDLDDAVAYLRAGSEVDDDEIAERGRRSGDELGDDPATAVRALAARVGSLVERTPGDVVVPTVAGTMRLDDYLATRAFELTVHGLDVATAAGAPVPAATRRSIPAAVRLAFARAVDRGEDALLIRALTGRAVLPPGYSVL